MAADPRTVKGRQALISEMASRMDHAEAHAPNLNRGEYIVSVGANTPGLDRRVAYHLDAGLRDGLSNVHAAERALAAVYGTATRARVGQNAPEDVQRAGRVRQLASRILSAQSAHGGDLYRVSTTAASGVPDGTGLRAHVEAALAGGKNAQQAAEAAFESYYGGAGQGFGEALVEQGRYQAPDRSTPTGRSFGDLDWAEKIVAAGHMGSTGRGDQEPQSDDIDSALRLRK